MIPLLALPNVKFDESSNKSVFGALPNWIRRGAVMAPPIDLVEDGPDLEAVIALDVGEAIGPRIGRRYRGLIRKRIAGRDLGQRHWNRVDLR